MYCKNKNRPFRQFCRYCLIIHNWLDEFCDIKIKNFDTNYPLLGFLSYSRENSKSSYCVPCNTGECQYHDDGTISQPNYLMIARQINGSKEMVIDEYHTINSESKIKENPNVDMRLNFEFEPKVSKKKEPKNGKIPRGKKVLRIERPNKPTYFKQFKDSIVKRFLMKALSDESYKGSVIFTDEVCLLPCFIEIQ